MIAGVDASVQDAAKQRSLAGDGNYPAAQVPEAAIFNSHPILLQEESELGPLTPESARDASILSNAFSTSSENRRPTQRRSDDSASHIPPPPGQSDSSHRQPQFSEATRPSGSHSRGFYGSYDASGEQ